MSSPIIQVDDLGKAYRLGQEDVKHAMLRDAILDIVKAPVRRWREMREPSNAEDQFWALRNVSFDVNQGEVVGIVGRNGAGKSTLLKILSRITEPTEGRVTLRGRVASLLEVGTGFHPELTGRENIYLNGAILGMTRLEIQSKFDEIVAFAEIEKFLDTQVKRYSSGMYVRLAFAVAAHLEPEILIVDEVLAVGDAEFQKKCLGKMGEVTKQGRTILFVSHNMAAVRLLCGSCVLLDKGRMIDSGPSHEIIDRYMSGEGSHDRSEVHFSRPGRAPIWITRASVISDGKSSSSLLLGAEFNLRIDFDAEPATLYPRFGFVISASDGTRVLGANNRYQPSTALAGRVKRGSIECSLGRVPLTPGTYSLSLWLGDPSGDWHIEPDAVTFKIVERDIWGLGKLPPTDGTSLWWPTEFELSERSDSVEPEAEHLYNEE
jgi:lipopolysaccharide transport system ATP-binding protein